MMIQMTQNDIMMVKTTKKWYNDDKITQKWYNNDKITQNDTVLITSHKYDKIVIHQINTMIQWYNVTREKKHSGQFLVKYPDYDCQN